MSSGTERRDSNWGFSGPKKGTPVAGISRDDIIPMGNSANKEAMYGTDRPIDGQSGS